MNFRTNVCPNCKKISGLVAVGPEFEHLIEEATEEVASVEIDVLVDGKVQKRKVQNKIIKRQVVAKKGPGSLCRRCGWSKRDPISVHYDAACDDCSEKLGRHAVDEGESPKKHFCQECSFDRIAKGKHDPDDAVTTFVCPCAGGCGKLDQAFVTVREGDLTHRLYGFDKDYFCSKEKCQQLAADATKLNSLASGASSGSP